ncbi:MAG: hypothetical protein QM756_40365 [Polyangiaceae bacterium]
MSPSLNSRSLLPGLFAVLAACSSPTPSGAAGGTSSASGGAPSNGGQSSSSGGTAGSGQGGNLSGGAPNEAGGSSALGGTTSVAGASASGSCELTAARLRVTEVDVGATVVQNEDEAALKVLALAPIPAGGSRLAWMSNDGKAHITELDANDMVTGTSFALPAMDFGDIYADSTGGVLLATRDAQGGGTLNCGEPTNLCGTPPSPAIPCYDMYMVRFDGGSETWATKLTNSSAALPPYSTGKTGSNVYMIWWYAHHGRIASDGTNFAAYFGSAISVSQSGCINIHQGDRMKVVGPGGALQSAGFDWGCSHSGYERILWDPSTKKYVTVCQNDAPTSGKSGRLAYAPATSTMLPVNLRYSNVGNVVLAKGGGYWLTVSDVRDGQPADADGFADVHLLHFSSGAPDKNLVLANDATLNARAPHLASYGADGLVAAWETSTAKGQLTTRSAGRTLYLQSLDAVSGAARGAPLAAGVAGNRYVEFKSYPDGSVAFPAAGSSATKIKIARVLPCSQ